MKYVPSWPENWPNELHRADFDRLWDGLAEWVLLGETVPPGAPDAGQRPEEAEFRREAKTSMVNAWLDEIDTQLRDIQGDISRYTSAAYWIEHPEYRALLETAFGFLRLVAHELARVRQESRFETAPAYASGNGLGMSSHDGRNRGQAGIPPGLEDAVDEELAHVFRYLGGLVEHFDDFEFWETHSEDRAGLVSALTLLRFWLAQFGQAANEGLKVSHLETRQ